MKLAIVVGHNSVSQGAVRKDTGETEYIWNGRLARRMQRIAPEFGIEAKAFFRQPMGSYSREIDLVYEQTEEWGADATIELHFNSFDGPASGTETLSSGTALSLRLAEAVQREIVLALGLSDRGIKTRTSGRGSRSLISGRAPAILIEPFFGSSSAGQAATDEEREQIRLAYAVIRGASEAFSSFPRRDLAQSRTVKAAETQRKAQAVQAQSGVMAGVAAAATQARDQIAGLPSIGALADWLPWISLGLIGVVLVATVVQRSMSDKIEEARLDDHERGIR